MVRTEKGLKFKLIELSIRPGTLSTVAAAIVLPIFGAFLFFLFWYILSLFIRELPAPISTLKTLFDLISNPFYDLGPNDKGIGWQLLTSLKRVFLGFLIGSLIALPAGFLIGMSSKLKEILNPIVQVLRPVSPMAWFPIGLALFKSSNEASIFVIAITSLWPTLINTALGVSSLPEDYKNLSRVFGFPFRYYITKVLLPYSLPYILTGFRLSLGIGWMVIVASEMLAGGIGIGFFVWDSWNALNLEKVLSAILLIGIVGLLIDPLFAKLTERLRR